MFWVSLPSNTCLIQSRVKALKEEPYSIKEAEAGMGFTTDNGKRSTTAPAPMDVDNAA